MKTRRKKLRLKRKYRKIIFIFFIILFFSTFIFSINKIIKWNVNNNNSSDIEKDIINNILIDIVEPSNDHTDLVNKPDTNTDIYWKYVTTPLIDVDINKLREENNDTIGWIQIAGTNINYPIVQTNDNDYYLNHDYYKNANTGGWIFMDYRNDIEKLSFNNIIYGHRRANKSMFGSLKNVLTDEWLSNSDNHIIKVSTTNYNYLFQVFSVYAIPNETYYIQTNFNSDEDKNYFINTILERSSYNFNTEINIDTNILTLSTCHNDSDRLVVHSKLIKINQK